jgi:hypothetical protein
MKILKSLKLKQAFPLVGAFGLLALLSAAGCSATDGTGTPTACSGLDVNASAQATVKAYSQACVALNDRALEVERKWRDTCNAINAELGEDTSNTSAEKACAVLNARIAKATGVTVNLEVKSECHADLSVQADCQASCKLPDCDIQANCEAGKLVVECNGACSGACDVTAPSVACTGTCSGKCTADVAVQCSGSCTGDCSDLAWNGTCDAGCSANFSGKCGGTCMGTCDSKDSTGKCAGICKGTCSAQANGSCSAKCSGSFSGSCKAQCKGSCEATGGAACMGKCEGTCSYQQGKADCQGECHGTCEGAVKPPTCTGKLSCEGAAECQASCDASARAKASCSSSADLVVTGDGAELYAAINAHIGQVKEAFALTLELRKPIVALAGKTASTFSALGDIGVAGGACVVASAGIFAEASASIDVSFQATLSVQGKAGASS